MKQKNTQTKRSKPPRKSPDIPVTKGMLDEARYELKHEIVSFRSEVGAQFKQVDATLAKVLSEVHQMRLLAEEQNARNIFVLDGYTSIYDRLDKVEKQIKDV